MSLSEITALYVRWGHPFPFLALWNCQGPVRKSQTALSTGVDSSWV